MPDSPSVLNYFIGTGILSFKAAGAPVYRDLGNAPSFKTKLALTKKEHKSSRDGARSIDRTTITDKKIEITFTLEEPTPENVAMASSAPCRPIPAVSRWSICSPSIRSPAP
jgi:hypothetical protein